MDETNPRSPNFAFTMGIEEEYQIIDRETLQLRSFLTKILDRARDALGDAVKSELHECSVECCTMPCRTAAEVRADLVRLRGTLGGILAPHGLTLLASGTHPISHWEDQQITGLERYQRHLEELQDLSRRALVYGLHVHVGVPDRELAVQVMNSARYLLPHLLAISSSSPFWSGRPTGLKSYRPSVWGACRRTGLPPAFSSRAEFDQYLELLVRTNCLDNVRRIWWDIRPHPHFDTVEFRIFDQVPLVDEAVAIAAVVQAVVIKFYRMLLQHLTFRAYPTLWIAENKWRAQRWGMDAKFVDFPRQTEAPVRRRVAGLLDFIDDVLDEMGNHAAVEPIRRICEGGSSADRQLSVYEKTKDTKAVAALLLAETFEGVPLIESPT